MDIKKSNVGFRFAPDIFIRLGEELNPSPSSGIIELIRNSYDADSEKCEVLFKYSNYKNHIEIIDDGVGMSLEDIQNGWFVLGKSKKTKEKTKLGRIPVGDKGLGRLAALRLGKEVTIKTRHFNNPDILNTFYINWSDFENAETIDEIEYKITQENSPGPSGTQIKIINISDNFSRRETKKLAREMVLLADPFGTDPHGFKPILKAPEYNDLSELVSRRYFDQAEFILNLNVDEEGNANVYVTDYHGNKLFKGDDLALRNKYDCPSFTFNLWIFILSPEKFIGRIVTLGQIREWLGEFGGTHIYQNDIRIAPYGDSGNDWLELNLLRSKSPELMPSTNTSIGKVDIFDSDQRLVQKTDRSGFIENDSFNEIKNACRDALIWMQKKRIDQRDKQFHEEKIKLDKEKEKNRQNINEEINKLPKAKKLVLRRVFNDYEKKRDKKESNLVREVQLNRTLSTAGIAAALFSHESANNPIQLIKSNIRTVKRRAQTLLSGKKYDEQMLGPIERILKSADALTVMSTFTLSVLDANKRRDQKVDIHKIIKDVLDQFSLFLKARKIACETKYDSGKPYFNGSVASIEAVMANLLANSIQAFDRNRVRERKIEVKTTINDGGYLEIHVLDNGPGITDISVNDIWLPGVTIRARGTGFGLTIVRDTVRDLGGKVQAIEKCELGGAEFIISLPIIGT